MMKCIVRYIFSLVLTLACLPQLHAQPQFLDSLEKELKKTDNDSTNVFLVIQLANRYNPYDSIKAKRYMENGYRLAKRLNWDYVYGYYYENKAIVTSFVSDITLKKLLFDTAISYYQKSADAKRNKKEASDAILSIANCKGQKGEILLGEQKYNEAIAEYMLAAEAWKNSDAPNRNIGVGVYYGKISTVYYKLDQFDKALEYDKLSYGLLMENNDEENAGFILIYICDDFLRLHQLDSGLFYLAKAKPIVEKLNNSALNVQYYNKLGNISRQKKDFKGAIGYFNKTLLISENKKDQYQAVASRKVIGVCYEQLDDYASARNYLVLALRGANEMNFEIERIEILKELVKIEKKTNHLADAFTYLEQLDIIKDSNSISTTKKAIAEIENKYKASEKEKQINQLQNDKQIQALSIKQKSTLNYFLLAAVAALLVVGFLAYRNIRNRQQLAKQQDELQQQRISELEKDKQLVAVDAMLKGQEEERSRLAKDLHDGLGGLLSGVKFSLSNMKDNLIITPDNMTVFERSLDMLDTSIRELRRVAHNMMPEMLTKFGLDEALKEYCNTINTTKLLTVKYQSLGMASSRLEKSTEIIIYRIIQELLNNIMKHAAATETMVQLIKEDDRFSIIVEDNGKGFDTALQKNNKGAGLTSIRSRVDYLKGELDIHSEQGKGTLVTIEFKV
jgi:two-component system, NarL family, sensor kinase